MATARAWGFAVAGACVLGGAVVAKATELDVRGAWQINIDCGGLATATSFVTLDQDLDTGVVSGTLGPGCGTVAFSTVAPFASCFATPSPFAGQVTGTAFSLPPSGYFQTDQTLESPAFFGCAATRIVVSDAYTGSIVATDGGGTATRIMGSLTNGVVQFYDAGDTLCQQFNGPLNFCTFDMLRADVGLGAGVTVQPNPRVSVTFDSVTTAGTASVTPLNEPDGEIPAEFQLLGGTLPIFYDVTTTAVVSGPITTCYGYPDVDQDGFVDGTFPAVAETDLRLLHEEDLLFVDRTVSLDTIANVVCAETTSLSQIVPGAAAAPPPAPGEANDVPLAGIKLLLKRNTEGVEVVRFVSRDKARLTPLTDSGPVLLGALFEISSASEGLATFTLPSTGWTFRNPHVWKFTGTGDVRKAVLKADKALVVKTTTTHLPLAGPHTEVSVRLTIGGDRYCVRFGPTTIVRDEANRFSAKGAKASALLDCSDAALGIASPSGAFVDGDPPG